MSVVDFCEALAEIGRRLYPADESPVGRVRSHILYYRER